MKFRYDVKVGLEYVCLCCICLFFENQVFVCSKNVYENMLFEICIIDKYIYKCNKECLVKNCIDIDSSRKSFMICYICYRKLLKGKIFVECFLNGL